MQVNSTEVRVEDGGGGGGGGVHEYVWLLVQSTVEFYISWEKLQCTLLERFPATTKLVYCVLFSNHTESIVL